MKFTCKMQKSAFFANIVRYAGVLITPEVTSFTERYALAIVKILMKPLVINFPIIQLSINSFSDHLSKKVYSTYRKKALCTKYTSVKKNHLSGNLSILNVPPKTLTKIKMKVTFSKKSKNKILFKKLLWKLTYSFHTCSPSLVLDLILLN